MLNPKKNIKQIEKKLLYSLKILYKAEIVKKYLIDKI